MVKNVSNVGGIRDVQCDCSHWIVIHIGLKVIFHGQCGQATGKDVMIFYCDTEQEMLDEINARGLELPVNVVE